MNIKRYDVSSDIGLSKKQVEERISSNLVNYDTSVKTKSIKEIVIKNIFTIFNIINTFLACMVLITGSFKNLLFMGGVICNTIISIIQEIRSKKTLDKLQVINESKIKVIRSSKEELVSIDEVVLDDIISLELGNQVVLDSVIKSGEVEVNESFITGEADTIYKKRGDMLLSGSFIVSGKCRARVEHIGLDNYTAKISATVKDTSSYSSEIMNSMNKIISTVSLVIIPLGLLLFTKQMGIDGNTRNEAILNTVAALIGMIPEGLVLLTSTVLAVSVIRLAKQKVLVQDLYCIEALARVDTICLDKTGTITEGLMEVIDVISLDNKYDINKIISNINYYLDDNNPTAIALKNRFGKNDDFNLIKKIPFSSAKKYSGCEFKEGKYLMGAPEFILDKVPKKIEEYSEKGRIILISHDKKPIGLIILQDKVRNNAKEILDYFKQQDVKVKIISGDNPITVSNIAKKAGLTNTKYIDASTLDTDEKIFNAVSKYDIFGRVSPVQKKKIILALQHLGHSTAMTGDGVNDVLALKESDCSVAMAAGTDAAKNISQLVLLDSDFKSMPHIVDEGRRSINNIERSASLFLVKTIYASVLAILFLFIDAPYPYIPIQLTLTSVLTVGIPSVILALEPNHNRVKGKFLINVFRRSLPASIAVIVCVLVVTLSGDVFNFERNEISTLTALSTTLCCFILLFKTCKPFNFLHRLLFGSMLILFLLLFFGIPSLFNFADFSALMTIVFICNGIIAFYIYSAMEDLINYLIVSKLDKKYYREF